MTAKEIEFYLYLNSPEKIIKWLEDEGVTERDDILYKLAPHVNSNMVSWASAIGRGEYGGSLAGISNCVDRIMKHFGFEK